MSLKTIRDKVGYRHLICYLLIPISSIISLAIMLNIAKKLSITPGHKYFVPWLVSLFIVYASEYYTLFMSLNWTNKALHVEQVMHNDALTGLLNRTAFEQYEKEINKEIKDKTAKFALAIIDLNFLKKLNDTYGHDKGDIALKILADDIKAMFGSCLCFRIGGDEFAVLITGANVEILSYLLMDFGNSIIINNNATNEWEKVSAACGYAVYSESIDKSFNDVFVRADAQMYANKKKMTAERKD